MKEHGGARGRSDEFNWKDGLNDRKGDQTEAQLSEDRQYKLVFWVCVAGAAVAAVILIFEFIKVPGATT